MSGFRRILDCLNWLPIRPTPVMLHSFMAAAAEKGYTQAEYRGSPRKIARSHIDFARKYGMDGVLVDVDTCMEAGAIGAGVDLPEDQPARVFAPLPGGLEACIESMEKDRLLRYDRIKVKLEAINLIKSEVGGDILVRGNADQGPFSLAMLALGIESFMTQLCDEPERVKLLIGRAMEVHLEFHRLVAEAGADITSFGDSSCGPGLISPAMYREFSLPWHRSMAEELERMSIATVCHMCGNIDAILGDLVSAGFPAIEVDHKTDILSAAARMKDKSVLFGPIDPTGVFFFGTPESVERSTEEVLDLFRDNRGLVIGAGCALPPGVSEENIRSFARTVARKTSK
jgi:uroporphyrinogen decarboxylase